MIALVLLPVSTCLVDILISLVQMWTFFTRNIEELLCQNADYLVNSISLRLRHLDQNAHAPNVLKVVLQHSNQKVLPLLRDTVDEVSCTRNNLFSIIFRLNMILYWNVDTKHWWFQVLSILDECYKENAVYFLRVLHVLVHAIHAWYPIAKVINATLSQASYCYDNK